MPPTLWFPIAGSIIATIVTALAMVRSARKAAEASQTVAHETAQATVQVARIEAGTATEGYVWKMLEQEKQEHAACAKELRESDKALSKAMADVGNLKEQVECLAEHKAFLLGLITTAGLESRLTRMMIEEAERGGGVVDKIEMILPELDLGEG